jgi:hypothetical protein
MVGVLEVEYVREEPAADVEQTRRNSAAQSSNMLVLSGTRRGPWCGITSTKF